MLDPRLIGEVGDLGLSKGSELITSTTISLIPRQSVYVRDGKRLEFALHL